MKSTLNAHFLDTPEGKRAQNIIGKCVHCGFCNANCPTYRLTGEELDGPRGRIYQIKNLLEEGVASPTVQYHLDTCLTCRRCETTCPSSVQYSQLADMARHFLEPRLKRPLRIKILRQLLLWFIPYHQRIGPFVRIGMFLRPILPTFIAQTIPIKEKAESDTKEPIPAKPIGTIILPAGCIQSVAKPQTNHATTELLHKLGYQVIATKQGCCGALAHHMSESERTNTQIKHNIEQWYRLLMEAEKNHQPAYIVMTASGCGVMVKDYPNIMQARNEPSTWIEKAQKISQHCVDLSEIITPEQLKTLIKKRAHNPLKEKIKVAYHPPCTLQHGQRNTGKIEALLTAIGYDLLPFADSDQCCGSAGTYSLFQAKIAQQLKAKKLHHLNGTQADIIATANIGCQLFLEGGANTPVKHWIQLVNQAI